MPICGYRQLFLSLFIAALIVPLSNSVAFASNSVTPLILHVDASHAGQGLIHADLTIPVKPGLLTLDYPKWIPGEHGPTGSTMNIAGLTFVSGGKSLTWYRDPVELFQYHVIVPPGDKSVEATFDYIDNIGVLQEKESDQETTPNIAVLAWNHFLFYPDGELSQDILVQADVIVPAGWQYACALEAQPSSLTPVHFKTESLYTMVDSPLLTGAYLRKYLLTAPTINPAVELDMAADSPDDFPANDYFIQNMKNLVVQEEKLFGSEHYRHYNFLLMLSDHIAENGLEHSESNETVLPEDAFQDSSSFNENADTLAHEYFHSWNGKYRRPFDLATPDYISPEKTELLWVYEGLTQYYGFVLAARSGLLSSDQVQEAWASQLDFSDNEVGRSWRSLQDTAVDAPELYQSPIAWSGYRRCLDFYQESSIYWLDADSIIRKLTNGKKSLDDFCRLFYFQSSPQLTAPVLKPYTEADVIGALNQVVPYDWWRFWNSRLNSIGLTTLDNGFADAGWNLVHNDTFNDRGDHGTVDGAGFHCGDSGEIDEISPNSIAFNAGLAPGMRIVAVDGRPFSGDVLTRQLNTAESTTTPIQLIVVEDRQYSVIELNYHAGQKFPHLQQLPNTTDYLSQILAPLPTPSH